MNFQQNDIQVSTELKLYIAALTSLGTQKAYMLRNSVNTTGAIMQIQGETNWILAYLSIMNKYILKSHRMFKVLSALETSFL